MTLPESLLVLALVALVTVFVVGPKVLARLGAMERTPSALTLHAPGGHGGVDNFRSWAPR